MHEWPLESPRNVATFTTWSVLRGVEPILNVAHHDGDGSWSFVGVEFDMNDAAIVSLEEIVNIDPSIASLADLPEGWRAWREDREAPWRRMKE